MKKLIYVGGFSGEDGARVAQRLKQDFSQDGFEILDGTMYGSDPAHSMPQVFKTALLQASAFVFVLNRDDDTFNWSVASYLGALSSRSVFIWLPPTIADCVSASIFLPVLKRQQKTIILHEEEGLMNILKLTLPAIACLERIPG